MNESRLADLDARLNLLHGKEQRERGIVENAHTGESDKQEAQRNLTKYQAEIKETQEEIDRLRADR